MVFSNTNIRPKAETRVKQLALQRVPKRSTQMLRYAVCILSFHCFSLPLFAQEDDLDFVDALAPVDASASAFHNEKFNEAERALLQGLSRRENPATQPKIRQVSAANEITAKQPIPKLVEATDRPAQAAALDDNAARSRPDLRAQPSTGSNTQLLNAINTQTDENVAGPKTLAGRDRSVRPAAPKQPAAQEKPAGGPAKQALRSTEPRLAPEGDIELRELRRELADTKSQLAAAELEISRLSAIIQGATRARLSLGESPRQPSLSPLKAEPKASAAREVEKVSIAPQADTAPAPNHDLQVATIAVEKADLRLGPGRNHSALMSLRQGSRLAVEARQGDWYRVFAPNGQRAWIHSSLVRFGDGASSLNDGSSVKVKGYDSKLR